MITVRHYSFVVMNSRLKKKWVVITAYTMYVCLYTVEVHVCLSICIQLRDFAMFEDVFEEDDFVTGRNTKTIPSS